LTNQTAVTTGTIVHPTVGSHQLRLYFAGLFHRRQERDQGILLHAKCFDRKLKNAAHLHPGQPASLRLQGICFPIRMRRWTERRFSQRLTFLFLIFLDDGNNYGFTAGAKKHTIINLP
jgi:hypothetical protein